MQIILKLISYPGYIPFGDGGLMVEKWGLIPHISNKSLGLNIDYKLVPIVARVNFDLGQIRK